MKVLLAVDGSEYTKKMLAYLATHDDLVGPKHQYTVLTVEAPLPPRARAALGKEVVDEYYREEAEKVQAPVAEFLARHGVTAERAVRVGPIGDTIAQLASEGRFDLVVMGSHGHGALATLVMGSVTTQVLAQCKVPLLIVR